MAKYYVEVINNSTFWHKDEAMTIQHRVGGPAVIWSDGGMEWRLNGNLHREDGPAMIWADGGTEWWLNGKVHREDGPAVEYASGDVQYWLNGQLMTKEQWEDALRPPEELTVAQIEQQLGKRIKIIK